MTIPVAPDSPSAEPRSSAEWGGRATRVEVNLDAVGANAAAICVHLGQSQLMAVVKADGYGHGAIPIARTALEFGACRLAVYTVGEGVALRRAGIEAPILVFGPPEKAEISAFLAHNLTPTVWDMEVARQLNRASAGRALPIQVKIDTGLTRAGIPAEDAAAFMYSLRELQMLKVEAVFTHFARADEADLAPTHSQLASFHAVLETLRNDGIPVGLRHCANSAATLSLPASHLDIARCGIALYGYNPAAVNRQGIVLQPALSWLSTITRLYRAPAGTGVGYGHDFLLDRPATIGLVPVGYGDGLMRSLGSGAGRVLVGGQWAPIVGRVSMDQITIDVTDVDGIAIGDEVVIIGRRGNRVQDAATLATAAGTISYEVLCGIMPRVPRLYVRGGEIQFDNRVCGG